MQRRFFFYASTFLKNASAFDLKRLGVFKKRRYLCKPMAIRSIFNIRKKPNKEERFRELFLAMHPKLIRYATTLMGDADEAKDMVSEVFGKAWENFSSLDDEASAWLYTATRNRCLNRLKHLQVEQSHIEAIILATQADVDNGYWAHEALLQKAEAIARSLPEPTCTILRLCYWEKKTYREVAEQLGISSDTVKKHISKALQMLRVEINKSPLRRG